MKVPIIIPVIILLFYIDVHETSLIEGTKTIVKRQQHVADLLLQNAVSNPAVSAGVNVLGNIAGFLNNAGEKLVQRLANPGSFEFNAQFKLDRNRPQDNYQEFYERRPEFHQHHHGNFHHQRHRPDRFNQQGYHQQGQYDNNYNGNNQNSFGSSESNENVWDSVTQSDVDYVDGKPVIKLNENEIRR